MTAFHWTPENQREFIECLSETGSITESCASVSMSRRAAYNLRHRACGFGFRIAWDAAVLLSRCAVSDQLTDRALSGQWTETVKDADSGVTKRLSYDRGLGLGLLSRLDRMCQFQANEGSLQMAAEMVSQDFDAFLDVIEAGADADAIRAFIDARHELWSMGRDLRLEPEFDRDETPVEVKAQVDTPPEMLLAAETAIQCELSQESVGSAEANPTIRAFHPLPSNCPRPGEAGYHNWITRQGWARV